MGSRLNQVFLNILVNAAQAIEERGEIRIASYCEGDQVLISFTDTGKGMSEEQRRRGFDPFFSTKPIGKGTGPGMSLSYGIIDKHGGTIDVESTPGEGTCFTIRLPIEGPEEEPVDDGN